MSKRIALAADHAGFEEKEKVKKTLDELGIAFDDLGTNSGESVDYPDFARKVAEGVSSGEYDQGLLVCGSGTGMAIAANKVKGVRAAVAWNEDIARLAREHNDANVLSLPARFISEEESAKVVKAFFESDFEGGRHGRRVDKISDIENSKS
jgi:ribose 5-phosphate isomerase B